MAWVGRRSGKAILGCVGAVVFVFADFRCMNWCARTRIKIRGISGIESRRPAVATGQTQQPPVRGSALSVTRAGDFWESGGVKTKSHSPQIPTLPISRFLQADRPDSIRSLVRTFIVGTKPVKPMASRPSVYRHGRRETATRGGRRQPGRRRPPDLRVHREIKAARWP